MVQRFASVVLVDPRGWILMQERDEHPAIDPEKWGFCGGHLDPGEDYEAGAHRELEEETGVVMPPGRLRDLGEWTVFHTHSQSVDPFHVFLAHTDLTDADIDCREGRRIVFVDPATVMQRDLTEAAKVALPDILASEHYAALAPPADGTVRLSCVILVDRRGWVLLQERDEWPRIDPDRWGFCGGHLDPGEDFLAGAVRELEEETGVVLDPAALTEVYAEDAPYAFRLYRADVALTDADIDCREGRQIVFVDPATLAGLDLGDLPARVLPRVLGL